MDEHYSEELKLQPSMFYAAATSENEVLSFPSRSCSARSAFFSFSRLIRDRRISIEKTQAAVGKECPSIAESTYARWESGKIPLTVSDTQLRELAIALRFMPEILISEYDKACHLYKTLSTADPENMEAAFFLAKLESLCLAQVPNEVSPEVRASVDSVLSAGRAFLATSKALATR